MAAGHAGQGLSAPDDRQMQQGSNLRTTAASVLTQGVQNVALFPSDPEVMIARHKEDILELLDHDLECASEDGLVV